MIRDFEKILAGKDLRSIGKSNAVILKIQNQNDFDCLFKNLNHPDRLVVMHAADAIEKLTFSKPLYLKKHKKKIIDLFNSAKNKELKWHLALLIPRLPLNIIEFGKAWDALTVWAKDKTNSRIVRVNAIQSLFEMTKYAPELTEDLHLTFLELEQENIPSINARIRIIRKLIDKIKKADPGFIIFCIPKPTKLIR